MVCFIHRVHPYSVLMLYQCLGYGALHPYYALMTCMPVSVCMSVLMPHVSIQIMSVLVPCVSVSVRMPVLVPHASISVHMSVLVPHASISVCMSVPVPCMSVSVHMSVGALHICWSACLYWYFTHLMVSIGTSYIYVSVSACPYRCLVHLLLLTLYMHGSIFLMFCFSYLS